MTTSKESFSSAAAAPSPPAPPAAGAAATATGAAAVTSNFSSKASRNSLSSRTVISSNTESSSSVVILVLAISFLLGRCGRGLGGLFVGGGRLLGHLGLGRRLFGALGRSWCLVGSLDRGGCLFGRPTLDELARLLLVQQLTEHRGGIARERRKHAGRCVQRGLGGAGELGEQYLAWLDLGKPGDLLGCEDLSRQIAALEHERLGGLGEILQGLRRGDRILQGEGESRRPDQLVVQTLDPRVIRRAPGQGHLDDLVLGTTGAKGAAKLLHLLDRETAVLRQEHRLCALQPLSDVFDCLDLFGSWHSLLLQRSNPSTKDEGLRRSQPALVGSLPLGP